MIEIITFIFALITPIAPVANKYLKARMNMVYHYIPAFITVILAAISLILRIA